MNPYQQIPVGIPVSQNQNPYPSHPYSSNFPDEPEHESPQIQVPSANINHQQFHPQYYYNGQQPIPMVQPGQFYAPGQAYPQQQYIMVANPAPVDPEKAKLEKNIQDLADRLDSGCYFIYKIWLYLTVGFSGLTGAQCCLSLLISVVFIREKEAWAVFLTNIIVLSWCIWLIQQALVMKNAMSNRSLEGAKRGFRSMLWFSAYYLLTFLSFVLTIEALMEDLPRDTKDESWMIAYVVAFIVGYVFPVFVNLFGAGKVISLLANREALVLELKTQFGAAVVNYA